MYLAGVLFFKLAAFLVFSRPSTSQILCSGCCNDTIYKPINEPRRSISSIWEANQLALCDRHLRRGWYRFTSYVGGQMPTSRVPSNRCGTAAPVWLRGNNPSVNDGVVRITGCINFFNLQGGCARTVNVHVRNCSTFYVYYLVPTYSCAVAYCAGTKQPCPYGKVDRNGTCYDPPVQFDRDYLGEPTISFVPPVGTADVTLNCFVPYIKDVSSWRNVTYRFTWYSEGRYLLTDEQCGNLPPNTTENDVNCPGRPLFSLLHSSDYTLNRWISCNVTARYTNNIINPWCTPKTVLEPFFAGIKVEPTVLRVEACSQNAHTVTLTPTIPIAQMSHSINLTITFSVPRGILLGHGSCSVHMKDLQPETVEIIPMCDNTAGPKDLDEVIILKIESTHSLFWFDAKLPSIWVSVKRNADNIQYCQAATDPHYYSFPSRLLSNAWGRRSSFTFMGRGDFLLYRNAERNFEIHTRQWACVESWRPDRFATCNCGVVLRDHNDVIEFNCCNQNLYFDTTTPMRIKVRSKERLAPGISVFQTIPGSSSNYRVLFPSGANVKLFRNTFGINVYFQGPRAKHGTNESGLCLYRNGMNVSYFGNSHRLLYGQSFFDSLPPKIENVTVKYNVPCKCESGKANEKECLGTLPFNFPNAMDGGGRITLSSGNVGRKKRDVENSDDPTDEDFEQFKLQVQSTASSRQKRALPDDNHFTKENATRYCMERITDSIAGKLCAQLGAKVQTLVDSCSLDLELTGDTTYVVSAAALLMNECGEIIGRNMSSYVNESSEEKPEIPSYLSNVLEKLCPNDCNFNGRCVNESCVCNDGYTAKDCGVSVYQVPEISMLQANGLCDRRQRPCRKVTVMGTGFLNSTNSTCHIKEFTVINGTWTPNKTEIKMPGVMTDLVLADCHLPESPVMPGHFHEVNEGTPAAGLVISMSNDGEHKSSKNLTFISFDSTCISCNVSTGCAKINASCLINGYCFAPNEPNPVDWCYQCIPRFSNSIWTRRKVNLPPQFLSSGQYYALYEENLELTIDVSDPEGMPVTLSLINGSPSGAVMRGNVLLWKVTNDSKTQLYLKATDACNATSTLNITVSLVVCPCRNGSCVPYPMKPRGSGLYECDCFPGFTGDKCETDIDECQSYPCLRGRCIDEVNQFKCVCHPGFVGKRCEINYDDCSSSPCVHGTCNDFTGGYTCGCISGYSGKNCDIDIDECESSPCQHGVCIDKVDSYKCQCHSGYTGFLCDTDVDECQSLPCVNGTCVDKVNNFTCNCEAGFTGVTCEVDIDNCPGINCGNGTCVDLVNNYTCRCQPGFIGRTCDVIESNCSESSCYPNVTCFSDGRLISCGPCPLDLTGDGKFCTDVDNCVSSKCTNGSTCVNGVGQYTCICQAGYTGKLCESDIDECVNNTCANGGLCIDGVNSYTCNCSGGFSGERCEKNIDKCVNHTCANGGSCMDGANSYTCNCSKGFTGERCEKNINDCLNVSCQHGGSCVDGINNLTCYCRAGYTGLWCETDIDECANHACLNGGTCVDGVYSYSCSCMEGFIGDRCETATCKLPQINDKHVTLGKGRKNRYLPGESITLDCLHGYKRVGNGFLECTDERNWTATNFHCEKTCLPPWTEFNKHCYLATSATYVWLEANKKCRRLNSTMVKISSKEENVFTARLAKAYFKRRNLLQGQMWLGLWKVDPNAEFQWADGTPLTGFSNWSPGEPNNHRGRELCTKMLVSGTYNVMSWNDVRCNTAKYKAMTVCEKPIREGD